MAYVEVEEDIGEKKIIVSGPYTGGIRGFNRTPFFSSNAWLIRGREKENKPSTAYYPEKVQ